MISRISGKTIKTRTLESFAGLHTLESYGKPRRMMLGGYVVYLGIDEDLVGFWFSMYSPREVTIKTQPSPTELESVALHSFAPRVCNFAMESTADRRVLYAIDEATDRRVLEVGIDYVDVLTKPHGKHLQYVNRVWTEYLQ